MCLPIPGTGLRTLNSELIYSSGWRLLLVYVSFLMSSKQHTGNNRESVQIKLLPGFIGQFGLKRVKLANKCIPLKS